MDRQRPITCLKSLEEAFAKSEKVTLYKTEYESILETLRSAMATGNEVSELKREVARIRKLAPTDVASVRARIKSDGSAKLQGGRAQKFASGNLFWMMCASFIGQTCRSGCGIGGESSLDYKTKPRTIIDANSNENGKRRSTRRFRITVSGKPSAGDQANERTDQCGVRNYRVYAELLLRSRCREITHAMRQSNQQQQDRENRNNER